MDYGDVAGVLEREPAACRQLAARAREHVREARPRFERSEDAEARLATAFASALSTGDVAALASVLAEDAVLYSDGGGKRVAALNPIYGRDKILRFFAAAFRKRTLPVAGRLVRINGALGFVAEREDGVETLALEVSGDAIVALYSVRNPDKLRHLG
jgi:RNA polymerase sigma-70 factor (ECF subfamily)